MTDADDARRALDTLREKLTELKYVDDLLAEIDRHNLAFPRDVLFDWFPIKVGWSHQFEEHVKYEATSRESANAAVSHWEGTMHRLRGEAASWGEADQSFVQSRVRPILDTQTDGLAGAAGRLTHVAESTKVLHGDFALLDDSLAHWEGMAADSFTDFYGAVQGAIDNHAWMAGHLAAHLAAAQQFVLVAQRSVKNAADAGAQAAEEQLKARAQSRGSWAGVKDFLALLGVVSSVVSVLPVVGDPTSRVLAAVGDIFSYAKDYVPQDSSTDTKKIEKDDARGISMDVTVAISDTYAGWDQTWDALETRVDALRGHLDGSLKKNTSGYLWIPPRPALADGPVPPGDFHHTSAA